LVTLLSGDEDWTSLYPFQNCTTPPCLVCTEMSQQPCGNTSLWRIMNFQLSPNSTYIETLMLGNDNCSETMNFTDSVFLVVETIGFWFIDANNDTWPEGWDNQCDSEDMPQGDVIVSDGGNDDNNAMNNPAANNTEIIGFKSEWFHVYIIPIIFNVTIFNPVDFYSSNVTDFYYDNMTDLYYDNMTEGFCMPILDYWNNETLGCPCNDTWNTTGYYNSSTNSFMGGRQIIPSLCPNNSCREIMFLNDTVKYANVRINVTEYKNGSVSKTMEMTMTSYDKDIGYSYGVEYLWYIFGAQ